VTLLSDAPARESAAADEPAVPRAIVVMAAVTAVCGLALFAYSRSDLWLDEALSVNIGRVPWDLLRPTLERDGAPPLYYAMLHLWTDVFGSGDEAARSLSGVFAAGTAVACWYAGRRWFGVPTAWLTAIVVLANPFVIRYATEARMYALEMFLVACGCIVVPRALERPSIGRLAAVALLTAALVYTQYWTFSLVGVVGLLLLIVAVRDRARRDASLRVVAALAVGLVLFAPWLPTFLSQRAHTGTPWGDAVLPGLSIGETFLGFAGDYEQEGWLLLLVLVPLVLLGTFARPIDGRRIEVDVRVQPRARWIALVGALTLVVALTVNYLAGQAFEERYSALVFPFFALLVGRGLSTFADRRVQLGAVVVVVGLGLVGGVRNAATQRTDAGKVAAVLRTEATPEDLVVYCPDQLGPSVARLYPVRRDGPRQVTYPDLTGPEFVDWRDYQDRLDATDPAAWADRLLGGSADRTIWLVTGPGYPNHEGACEALSERLAETRTREQLVLPEDSSFEMPGLQRFAPRSS
jgi:uncharacterized membrane protein